MRTLQTQAILARITAADARRYGIVSVSYLASSLLLGTIGRAYLTSDGAVTLRPDLALAALLLIVFGWPYVPVAVVALLIETLRTPTVGGTAAFVVVDTLMTSSVALILSVAIREFTQKREWGSQSDLLVFGTSAVLLPIIPAFCDQFFLPQQRETPAFFITWLALFVPIVSIIPAGLKVIEWATADPRPPIFEFLGPRVRLEVQAAQIGFMVVGTLFVFVERLSGGPGTVYPLFIAVFWMALTSGLTAASLGFLLAQGLLVSASKLMHSPTIPYDVQLGAAILGSSSLVAGALVSARRGAEEMLREQSEAMRRQLAEMQIIRRLADSIIAMQDESALHSLGAEAIGEQLGADQVWLLWIPAGAPSAQERGFWAATPRTGRDRFAPDLQSPQMAPLWTDLEAFRTQFTSRADMPSAKMMATGLDVALHGASGVKSLLLHPFSFEPSGFYVAVILTYSMFHPWGQEQLQFLTAICDQITIALQKMRLLREREERSRAFASISQAIVAETGEAFFQSLVVRLAEAAESRGAYALRIRPTEREARVLAIADSGRSGPEFTFNTSGTPAEWTLRQGTLAIQDNAYVQFPRFREVIGMEVHGFASTRLISSKGEPLGTIAVYDDGPLRDPEYIASVLRIFALRIAAEIERTERERELRESEANIRRLLETAHEGIWILNGQGKAEFVNPSMAAMLGYSPSEMIGRTMSDFVAIDDESKAAAIDFRRQLSGTASQHDFLFKRRDGTLVWTMLSMSPIRSEEGEYRGTLAMVTDISERKRNEEILEDRVRDRTAALVERTEELTAYNKEMEEFCYSISHDLRGPLRAIDGFSRAVVEDLGPELDSGVSDHLFRVRRAANRMSDLIDALLRLYRLSRVEINREEVDLTEMAESILADLARSEPERANRWKVQAGLTGVGDARLLHIALENLLANAWKFTSKVADPLIEVGRTKDPEGKTTLFVRDNGIGFDMAYSNKLFKPFERLHSELEYAGTGIGLATVHRIISRHGGEIRATGEVGKGATFYFTLEGGTKKAASAKKIHAAVPK